MQGGYSGVQFQVDNRVQKVDQYSTDFIADQAVSMIEQFQRFPDHPWFLYVAPFAPHFPYTAAPEDANADVGAQPDTPALDETDLSDKPPWVQYRGIPNLDGTPAEVWQKQSRSLLAVDRMVQRLFDAIDDPDNTLAIFISDNGYLLGEHGVSEDKRIPYPESVHVPFMMRWPARLQGGTTDDRFALNVDIAPTLLEAAGIDAQVMPALDGHSLLGSYRRSDVYLEGYNSKENAYDASFPAWASLLTPTAQYTEWYGSDNRVFRELYDRTTDPYELENLAIVNPAAAAELSGPMAQRLRQLRVCAGTTGPTACT
jgi:arylsulfatase A-like enzyme